MKRYFSLLLVLIMLPLLCSCPQEEEGPVVKCPYASDLEEFYFMGINRPGAFYYRNSEFDSRVDVWSDSTCLEFKDDKTFKLYHHLICDPYFDSRPFCELNDDESNIYVLELSGVWDFTQWYEYSVNLYSYYPRTTPPLSDRNRVRFIKGNFYLNITESTIGSHIGETITGDLSVSCQWILGSRYAQYTFKFKLPMFTSTDFLKIHTYGSFKF